ncbi:hypothetical protein SAMN05421820_103476 [Pedobacter steynii]|uniref:Uncharacterized protein n=1 Tax=Pedobacter steynii TaxID=430522 RepID=A0A1G9S665_9SPHI|nr:hypothetical protein SAMN05421820_103476 [Pedobacter steynii]
MKQGLFCALKKTVLSNRQDRFNVLSFPKKTISTTLPVYRVALYPEDLSRR